MTDELEKLRRWVGSEETIQETLTPALVQRFEATLGGETKPPVAGAIAPRLIHFCLCQPVPQTAELGPDGHPARGGFLPPVALPKRMWAGSTIEFTSELLVGDLVYRRSRVSDVSFKNGRTGPLCFVTVDHSIGVQERECIAERQTIVYRGEVSGSTRSPEDDPAAQPGDVCREVVASPSLLFRFSALTFNTHRIHYDRTFAKNVEGYPGLVVHGPLQAVLLYRLAAEMGERGLPRLFRFKSTTPLFDLDPILVHGRLIEDKSASLWTARRGGPVAMRAEALWK